MQLINLQEAAQCMSVPTGWVLGMIELGQLEPIQALDGSIAIDACQIEANNWDCTRQDSAASYAHLMAMAEKITAH